MRINCSTIHSIGCCTSSVLFPFMQNRRIVIHFLICSFSRTLYYEFNEVFISTVSCATLESVIPCVNEKNKNFRICITFCFTAAFLLFSHIMCILAGMTPL